MFADSGLYGCHALCLIAQRIFYYTELYLFQTEILFDSNRSNEFSTLLEIQYPEDQEHIIVIFRGLV